MINIKIGEVLAKHPEYKAQKQRRSFWRSTAKCTADHVHDTDARGYPIIHRFDCESVKTYNKRKQRTKPRNHSGPVEKKFNDFVFRNEITRPSEMDPQLQELYNDCDLYGTAINDYMKKAMFRAQIDGVRGILPDSTGPSDGRILTKAQAMYEGERPFLRDIDADNILNWSMVDCFLTEVIILFQDQDGKPFAKYYNEEICFDIILSPIGRSGEYRVDGVSEPIPHGYAPYMPLILIRPTEWESHIAPLAEVQQGITNLLSLLNQQIYTKTFTKYLLSGLKLAKDDEGDAQPPTKFEWEDDTVMAVKDQGVTKVDLGSDVSQTEMILTVISNEEENLYRTAGLSAPNPLKTGQPESGIAKAFSFNNLEVELKSLSDTAEAAENGLLKRLWVAYGKPGEPEPTIYDDKFEAPDLAEELADLKGARDVSLPKIVYNKMVTELVHKFFSLSKEELDQLVAELEAEEKAQAPTQTPAVSGGNGAE
jgi:hypothetical protein